MTVTSPQKMRHGKELKLSYAGDSAETTVLSRDPGVVTSNAEAVERLVAALGNPDTTHEQTRPGGAVAAWKGSLVWEDVPGATIASFLSAYKTHEGASRASSALLLKYVEAMLVEGELTEWTVGIMSGELDAATNLGGHSVTHVRRKPDERAQDQESRGVYVIRRLLSPRDEAIDLNAESYAAALDVTRDGVLNDPGRGAKSRTKVVPKEASGPAIRFTRGSGSRDGVIPPSPQKGVLLIYPLDADAARVASDKPVYAIGLSFPTSAKAKLVPYVVTNTYWNQELLGLIK